MNKVILTYDIGTTGNKCSLFDENGRNICSETVTYNTIYPKSGWSEQRAEDFWESVVFGTKRLLEKSGISPKQIEAIGLSGHMNGCLPVDSEGNALYNEIIHSDARSGKECDEILNILGFMEYYKITGNRLDPHYSFPKLLWFKNNYPDIYNKTAFFLNSKDYIGFKLTGNLGITDYSDASMTGLLDISKKEWSQKLIKGTGIDANKLPEIRKSYDIIGHVTAEVASILGLEQGIPVVAGGGDAVCAMKGAGVADLLQAYNYIGSSSWISILNDKPIFDDSARIFNFYDIDGQNMNICGTVQCATISYDWVLNNIAKHEVEECKKEGVNVFDYMDDLAAGVPIGSNGVFFLPYLMGERTPLWDKNTKGGFLGITLYNNREDLFRSTYEGIAYTLRSVLDVYEENNLSPQSLNLIGGGAQSKFWNEVMCNVYRKEIRIHKFPREATSLGAAMAAGVGVGIFKDFKDAVSKVEFNRVLKPDEKIVEEYKKYYNIYKMMYPNLKKVFEEISKL